MGAGTFALLVTVGVTDIKLKSHAL